LRAAGFRSGAQGPTSLKSSRNRLSQKTTSPSTNVACNTKWGYACFRMLRNTTAKRRVWRKPVFYHFYEVKSIANNAKRLKSLPFKWIKTWKRKAPQKQNLEVKIRQWMQSQRSFLPQQF
jgi:hypothetical protein